MRAALHDVTNRPREAAAGPRKALRPAAAEAVDVAALRAGTAVFYGHPTLAWAEGVVERVDVKGGLVRVRDLHSRESHVVKADAIHHQCAVVGPGVLGDDRERTGAAREAARGCHDLLGLPDLHEATLLHTVQLRFRQDLVYTEMGPIVLAVNPFKYSIPAYQDSRMAAYISEEPGLPPHAWRVAHAAYQDMTHSGRSQAILISGESGAGKTESTKTVLKYLGRLSCQSGPDGAAGSSRSRAAEVYEKLNEMNPLLESFGNAKTLRNHNSSRFGKFVKVHFDAHGLIEGATVTNYLLEKSRIVAQAPGERGYHIFYQLLAGCSAADKERYGLLDAGQYSCLSQGGCLEVPGLDDAEGYQQVWHAMDVLGISAAERHDIVSTLAAILNLQNVQFARVSDDDCVVEGRTQPFLEQATRLLGLDAAALARGLLTATTVVRAETIVRPLPAAKAAAVRDTISKALYNALFHWLVHRVNQVLAPRSSGPQLAYQPFIGILDIFGFETFDTNGFEQLCINFANESLQRHYNEHVFALELEECAAEGIDVTAVHFQDNQPCLDLLAKPHGGIFSLLDEESSFPKATDDTFAAKVYEQCAGHPDFARPRIAQPTFTVHHYAGPVEYTTTDFLEKNRDALGEGLLGLLQGSRSPFIAALALHFARPPDRPGRGGAARPLTLGGQFRAQLQQLQAVIAATQPHWIRCVKPNSLQRPDVFEPKLVMAQLTSSGVLQTVQMLRNGYPFRIPHRHFWSGFRLLAPPSHPPASAQPLDYHAECQRLVATVRGKGLVPSALHIQVGHTKVFLKQRAYEALVKARRTAEAERIVPVQCHLRALLARLAVHRRLLRIAAAVALQRCVRRWRAARRHCAALTLQTRWRAMALCREERRERLALLRRERRRHERLRGSSLRLLVAVHGVMAEVLAERQALEATEGEAWQQLRSAEAAGRDAVQRRVDSRTDWAAACEALRAANAQLTAERDAARQERDDAVRRLAAAPAVPHPPPGDDWRLISRLQNAEARLQNEVHHLRAALEEAQSRVRVLEGQLVACSATPQRLGPKYSRALPPSSPAGLEDIQTPQKALFASGPSFHCDGGATQEQDGILDSPEFSSPGPLPPHEPDPTEAQVALHARWGHVSAELREMVVAAYRQGRPAHDKQGPRPPPASRPAPR
eukprot:EG_transcript_812